MEQVYFSNKKHLNKIKSKSYNGFYFDSMLEANYARFLDSVKKEKKEIKKIEYQYKIVLEHNGIFIANYYMDMKVTLKNGTIEMHEVKGASSQLWYLKWNLSRALFPEYNYVLVK